MNEMKNALNARAEMEVAKEKSERTFAAGPKQPSRYKVYDKIKERVSPRAVDIVILVTSVLIVALLIIGIVTGKPQQ